MSPESTGRKSGGQSQKSLAQRFRAFELYARVGSLQDALPEPTRLDGFLALGRNEERAGRFRNAACLYSAGEHFGYGILSPKIKLGTPAPSLKQMIDSELSDLQERAKVRREAAMATYTFVQHLYESAAKLSDIAFVAGDYHGALAYARSAEALSAVDVSASPYLSTAFEGTRISEDLPS